MRIAIIFSRKLSYSRAQLCSLGHNALRAFPQSVAFALCLCSSHKSRTCEFAFIFPRDFCDITVFWQSIIHIKDLKDSCVLPAT